MRAVEQLEQDNISADVLYLPTIKPFDYQAVRNSVEKTRRVLSIEEHSVFGGLADEILRSIAGDFAFKSVFLNIPNLFVHGYGTYEDHCEHLGLTSDSIVRHVKQNLLVDEKNISSA